MRPRLWIVGAGMGSPALLTAQAEALLRGAQRLLAPPRLAGELREVNPAAEAVSVAEMLRSLREDPVETVVAVSGDVGFYSLADRLRRELGEVYAIEAVNGVSSLQYLCGKCGVPWQDVRAVSLHGRPGRLLGPASYNRRTFALVSDGEQVRALLRELRGCAVRVTVGEELSSPRERIRSGAPEALCEEAFADLVAILLENPAPADRAARLRDDAFVRGAVPMTKEAVRTLSVARLAVRPGDTVWDVGAGTGSVSVALARAACDGIVCAVERSPQALELIRQNRTRLGAWNIVPVEAEAPTGLDELPAPDRVFIGGSGGQLHGILAAVTRSAADCITCVNAITLESVSAAMEGLAAHGFTDVEAVCANIAEARLVGRSHMMQAHNPVYIISGRWRR